MNAPLEFTGERFHPDKGGEMWYEHWHRYHLVTPWVQGRRVLDIACGEGYGSAKMAESAASVVGVDLSRETVEHAGAVYSHRANLRFLEGGCTAIPLPKAAVDVVVSFETLEHIAEHADFLTEMKRVLVKGGLAIVSTPNKAEYGDARGHANAFHVKELYFDEFDALMQSQFIHVKYLGQRNGFHSIIAPTDAAPGTGKLIVDTMQANADLAPRPLYVIALASDDPQTLARLDMTASALTALEDNQVDVFMQIWRHSQHLEQRVAALEAENAALRAAQGVRG